MRRRVLLALACLCAPAATLAALDGPTAQIIGGTPVAEGSWPALTPLIAAGNPALSGQFCGGTLIAPQRVLTAAHCVVDGAGATVSPTTITVAPGARLLSAVSVQIPLTRIDVHPAYDKDTFAWDAAVLHLAVPSAAPYVALPSQGEVPEAGMATEVAGWGTMTSGVGDYPDGAMEVGAPVLADAGCASYGADYQPESMLCAGVLAGGEDACQGDSGGPLALGPARTMVGIVSWGTGCALAGFPGVYTRVFAVRGWVAQSAGITPGAPANLSLTRLDAATVRISWDAPTDYSWSLDGYRVWVNGVAIAERSVAERSIDVASPEGVDALIEVAGVSAAGAGSRAGVGRMPVVTPSTPEVPSVPVTPVDPIVSPPGMVVRPVLRGRMTIGSRVTATRGTWSGEGVTTRVRFERATRARGPWRAVAKDGVTYRIRRFDRGMYLRARVTATTVAGSIIARSAARRVR